MKKLIGPFSQLLTLRNLPDKGHLNDSQLEILTDAGILCEKGTIVELGSFADLRDQADSIEELEQPCVALPGFVDCHTHLCWAGSRAGDYARRVTGATYQEIAAEGGGILDTVRKTRAASQQELVELVVRRCGMLRQRGVTTCEVKSGYGLSVEAELKMLRAVQEAKELQDLTLVSTCLAAHLTPPEFDDESSYLDHITKELLPMVLKENLASRVDIFVEKGAFSIAAARKYLLQAKAMGFDLVVHADQFSTGGAQLAAEVGAVSADHLEVSEKGDLEALAKGGVIPVVLPGASLGLGMQFSPAHAALDIGLPLVIASDWNPGSAPHGDLLTQAALIGAAEKLTMAETFAAITCRAANALNLSDRGRLEAKMRADFVCYQTNDFREILYFQGSLRPNATYIAGAASANEPIRSAT